MSDFITQNEDSVKKQGFLHKAKNFLMPRTKNQVTLLSEDEFNKELMKEDANSGARKMHIPSRDKATQSRRTGKYYSSSNTITLNSGNIEFYKKRLPIIGNLPMRTQYLLSLFIMALGLCAIFMTAVISGSNKDKANQLQNNITFLVTDLQTLASVLNRSIIEEINNFDAVSKQIDSIDKKIKLINYMSAQLGVEHNPTIEQMNIATNWQKIVKNISQLNSDKEVKPYDSTNFGVYLSYLNTMSNLVGNYRELPEMTVLLSNIEKVKSGVNLLSNGVESQIITNIKQDNEAIKNALINIRWNSSLAKNNFPTYEKLAMTWVATQPALSTILVSSNNGLDTKRLVLAINDNISVAANQISTGLLKYPYMTVASVQRVQIIYYICGALILLGFGTMILIYLTEQKNTTLIDRLENDQNHNAIMKVLDAMGPLSDGDLTNKISVSSDLTSAVADALNNLAEQFCAVVKDIRDASENIGLKTQQVNSMSATMYQEGEQQTMQINENGKAVLKLTELISRVSQKTYKGEGVANQTLQASAEGTSAVRESVSAMNSIKTNMNETVRLMVRLDNLSDQISKIMELLSDITEETRILGTNATVQASKAGEAGKGFKIVADSVTALSNKAKDATNKINALINATKTDLQEIINSVEKTNVEIEKGTQLSAQAGDAFDKIKTVSNELTEIMKEISVDTQKQVKMANDISIDMQTVLDSTKHTMTSNTSIVGSIGEMTQIAEDLNKKVKHFKVD